jgi:hypothetical protein
MSFDLATILRESDLADPSTRCCGSGHRSSAPSRWTSCPVAWHRAAGLDRGDTAAVRLPKGGSGKVLETELRALL